MKSEHHNFIGMYENAMDTYACDWLIKMFEHNAGQAKPGVVVNNNDMVTDPSIKSSLDLAISLDRYDHIMVNAIVMQSLALGVEEYKKAYPTLEDASAWDTVPDYNIQRYLPGQGFRKYHCEHGIHNPYIILAWMFYLNDVDDGGTDFPYLGMQLNAKKGNLAIWPAGFTHMHAGIVSETKTKYIVTGWFQFENNFYERRRNQKKAELNFPSDPDWAENVMPAPPSRRT